MKALATTLEGRELASLRTGAGLFGLSSFSDGHLLSLGSSFRPVLLLRGLVKSELPANKPTSP
jgi:hypothetical protein